MKKNIIISGASRGIGRATALQLAGEDCTLFLLARKLDELQTLVAEIEQLNGKAYAIQTDVSDAKAVELSFIEIFKYIQNIDILVCNAGIGVVTDYEMVSETDYDKILDVNLKGTFLLSQMAVKTMKQQKSGHIVAVASDVSKRTFQGGAVYCASKYAQHALMDALRKEVRQHGIKVSVIYPGLVDTHFHRRPQGDASHDQWLRAEEVADAIAYILSRPKHLVIDELMLHPLSQEW